MALSFDVTAHEAEQISLLADRAYALDRGHSGRGTRKLIDWRMDFTAVHASGNPLRLADLLAADNFNFAHDAFGIARHLDRTTGELMNCFSPRFSAPVAEAA